MTRRLIALTACALGTLGATPALAADDPLGELNALRAAYGAPQLSATGAPEFEQALAQAHDAGTPSASEDGLPDCVVCSYRSTFSWSGSTRWVGPIFQEATGTSGGVVVATFPRNASVRDTMTRFPITAAYLLSPVISGATVVARAGNADLILVERNSAPGGPGPLRIWPESTQVTPGTPFVVFGGESETLTVTPTAGRFAGTGGEMAPLPDMPTATYAYVDRVVSYGSAYRLSAGGFTLDITTAPLPAAPMGPPAFDRTVTARQKAAFLRASRGTPALARRIWGAVGPRVTIRRARDCDMGAPACGNGTPSRLSLTLNTSMFGTSPWQRFEIQRWQGWSILALAIPEKGYAAFAAMIKKSKRYRCVKVGSYTGRSTCASPAIYFEEEYARWATGTRTLGPYRTPPVLTRSQMTRFLNTWFYLPPERGDSLF